MWPRLRALLITVVMVFAGLEALPLPALKKRHLNHRVAREEVLRWQDMLAAVGVEMSRAELVSTAIKWSRRTNKHRRALIKPFRIIERKLGMGQRWGLFTYTDPYAGRLVVEGTRGGNAWETLYRAPNEGDPRLVSTLRYRRMRGIWDDAGDRPHPGTFYNRWVTWLARRLFTEDPTLQQVRVRFDRLTIQPPGQGGKRPTPKPVHVRTRKREDVL
jgi:hypothetical protein